MRVRILNGWPLLGLISVLLAAGTTALWAGTSDATAALRTVIRATARSSLALFCLAFTASALVRLAPNAWTAWQRRNRRQIGLAFAVSHGIHAAALVALAISAPALFAELTGPGTLVLGGVAYLFILAMAATSFDRTATALGRRAWAALHATGIWFLWLSFAVIYGRRFLSDLDYWPAMAVLGLALAIRIAGRRTIPVAG